MDNLESINKSHISIYGNLTLEKKYDSVKQIMNKSKLIKDIPIQNNSILVDKLPVLAGSVLFNNQKNNNANRQANKIFSNFDHIVFKGAGTTIDDEEIKKMRKLQQAITYQSSLIQQIEENKRKKEVEKKAKEKENENERMHYQQMRNEEEANKILFKEQEKILKNKQFLMAKSITERKMEPVNNKSENSGILKSKMFKLGDQTSKNQRKHAEIIDSISIKPFLKSPLAANHSKEYDRVFIDVKSQIKNYLSQQMGNLNKVVSKNSQLMRKEITNFHKMTKKLKNQKENFNDQLDSLRNKIECFKKEENLKHKKIIWAIEQKKSYHIVPNYKFEYEESKKEQKVYDKNLRILFGEKYHSNFDEVESLDEINNKMRFDLGIIDEYNYRETVQDAAIFDGSNLDKMYYESSDFYRN